MNIESGSKTNTGSSTKFLAGLIMGAVIGAAVALLYAPKPGSETRRLVKEKASAIKERASKTVGKIKGSADSLRKTES
jgi:gas vesicle protein